MPNSSALWMAAGLLWVLDASVNISMEPFRAFVGDMLPPRQRKIGFAMQSVFIGAGAVLSSMLPWMLSNVFGLAADASASASRIPMAVHVSFYIGAAVFLAAVLHTVLTTPRASARGHGGVCGRQGRGGGPMNALVEILRDIASMPHVMRRLAVVQFFTWFGLFCMWIYFAPAIARGLFGGEPGTAAYQRGIEWAGVCFGVYNGTAFVLFAPGSVCSASACAMSLMGCCFQ